MKQLVTEARRAITLYSIAWCIWRSRIKSLSGRRSIYFINDLKVGDIISSNDVARIRQHMV